MESEIIDGNLFLPTLHRICTPSKAKALLLRPRKNALPVCIKDISPRSISERGQFLIIHTASRCSFDQGFVIHDCLIEAEASSKVVCCIAITFENAAGNIASETALADHVNRLAGGHLIKAFSQLIDGDVIEALDVSALIFTDCSGIKQSYAAVSRELIGILNMPLLQNPGCNIVYHKACHIDRILCG